MNWRSLSAFVCVIYIGVCIAENYEEDEKYETALRMIEQMADTRKGLSALKQVVDSIDGDLQKTHMEKRKVKDLTTKRKGLEVLKRILKEMDADLVMEQKRTCQLNLGGHCATESAASVADQWHYLNSPLSPGRKRRDTGLYQKLVDGRLLQ